MSYDIRPTNGSKVIGAVIITRRVSVPLMPRLLPEISELKRLYVAACFVDMAIEAGIIKVSRQPHPEV